MRKVLHLICAMLLILSVLPKSAMASEVNHEFHNVNELSTWLWKTSKIVSEPDVVINNLVKEGATDLYLQVNGDIRTKYYQSFISKAASNGIRVHALAGSTSWVDEIKGEKRQDTFTKWIERYQRIAVGNERFAGIHLDVEPYTHENYKANMNYYLQNYQTLLVNFKAKADQMGLEFGIDIPFWYAGVEYNTAYGEGNLAEFVSQHVKNISIMAYRDFALAGRRSDGIIKIATTQMDLFAKYNVNGSIAVETGRLSASENYVTFFEEDKEYLYSQLDLVYDHFKNHPAFNGIAIHHYDTWMALK